MYELEIFPPSGRAYAEVFSPDILGLLGKSIQSVVATLLPAAILAALTGYFLGLKAPEPVRRSADHWPPPLGGRDGHRYRGPVVPAADVSWNAAARKF